MVECVNDSNSRMMVGYSPNRNGSAIAFSFKPEVFEDNSD